MRRAVLALAWTAVAVWSLLAWGAYGLLDFVGGLAAGGVGSIAVDPTAGAAVAWVVNAVKGLGLFAILAIWGFVSVVILAFGWILSRAVGGAGRVDVSYYQGYRTVHPPQAYPPTGYPHAPDGMRDVTPRQPPTAPDRLGGPRRD
ncbi:hypothetical protein [Salinarimonas soli]|uniref:Uncharacterized protein n=1 Tax=Salinarimonas soli TaxID=1638099 RepID=A0A5B2VIL9_9HYPH|nr:hypothetical protein [Salinarimonas soli]KAA2238360.1 hypothetical protein F0L46_05480 [Salinarimonas soli]